MAIKDLEKREGRISRKMFYAIKNKRGDLFLRRSEQVSKYCLKVTGEIRKSPVTLKII